MLGRPLVEGNPNPDSFTNPNPITPSTLPTCPRVPRTATKAKTASS